MVRYPFSLDRMISVDDNLSACGHAQAGGNVVYRAEKADCQPFPILGDGKLLRGVSRNFEVFDPLDFLAEIIQHPSSPRGLRRGRHPRVACRGVAESEAGYSNKMRGQHTKRADPANPDIAAIETDEEDTNYRKLCRMRWAALIKWVYEVDPLLCPKCGGTMKIVAFIERRDQADVIEKILKHCGLWQRPASRAPPKTTGPPVQPVLDLSYVDSDEYLLAL